MKAPPSASLAEMPAIAEPNCTREITRPLHTSLRSHRGCQVGRLACHGRELICYRRSTSKTADRCEPSGIIQRACAES